MRRLILAVALTGCTALLGSNYQRMERLPGSMGVIYLYAGEITPLQSVVVDRDGETTGATHSITLVREGYYPYLTSPGIVRVLTGTEKDAACIMIPVETNSEQWVRITNGKKGQPRVAEVAKEQAEAEIGGHKMISKESVGPASGAWDVECPWAGDDPAATPPTE